MTQQQELQDMTMSLAQAFSDIRSMKRFYLVIDKKSQKITKTLELSDKHFDKTLMIIDVKSQQVFDHAKADWQDISEERKANLANTAKNKRVERRDRKTKKAKGTQSTHRKTRRSTGRKRADTDET